MATQPVLRGSHVAVITNSRSPGTLAAAALSTAGLTSTMQRLAVDASPEDFATAIQASLADEHVDGVMVIHAPALATALDSNAARHIDEAARNTTKPVIAVLLGSADGPVQPNSPVPAFAFPEQAAAVLGRSFGYGCWLRAEAEQAAPSLTPIDPAAAQAAIGILLAAHPGESVVLDAEAQRDLLHTYGITMADVAIATPDTAVEVARSVGYPVAVKAGRRGVGRTVRSGVALDLADDDDITDSVAQMQRGAR